MAGRPVDEARRDELLDAVVGYALAHGLGAMTWRPVALALGVSTTSLVHRFGSKEGMVQAVQARLRERILVETSAEAPGEVVELTRRVWARVSHPSRAQEFRLFFEVYGQALADPARFEEFLGHVVADPLQSFGADATGTLVLAALRGLVLDLLATGDRARVDAAAAELLRRLGSPSG
ncbi:MAG: TetR/AcrR family transcriptional regulator [Microbacterium sp.]|uniref:TetR family transcriptional regulator n=1 Tax=Microbacterium sp. TaxID=51671 RepID=UPI0039E29514